MSDDLTRKQLNYQSTIRSNRNGSNRRSFPHILMIGSPRLFRAVGDPSSYTYSNATPVTGRIFVKRASRPRIGTLFAIWYWVNHILIFTFIEYNGYRPFPPPNLDYIKIRYFEYDHNKSSAPEYTHASYPHRNNQPPPSNSLWVGIEKRANDHRKWRMANFMNCDNFGKTRGNFQGKTAFLLSSCVRV